MKRERYKMLWVGRPGNIKTDAVPTAYIGDSFENARKSCKGCTLLGNGCYAWGATVRGFGSVLKAYKTNPERYSFEYAMNIRRKRAKMIRIGALGDPARADRVELLRAADVARAEGLSVVGYTHHWRNEPRTGVLRKILMASCNNVAESKEALARGWIPAVVIPWNQEGNTFEMPGGKKGLVCPAQTKKSMTCNDCRMCAVDHPVWKAGKVSGIGFRDHGPKSRRKIAAARVASHKRVRTLPLAG